MAEREGVIGILLMTEKDLDESIESRGDLALQKNKDYTELQEKLQMHIN